MKRCMILRRCTFSSFNDKSKFVSWDAFFLVNLSLPPLPNQFPNNKSSNLLFGYQTKIFQKWKLFKFWRHWGKNEKITTMKNPPSDDEDCVTWKFILMVYMQSWDNSSRNDTFSKKLPKSENKRRICWYYIKVFILPKNQAFHRWQKASSVLLTVEEQWFGLVPCKNKDFKNKIVEIYVSYCLIH